jgi:multimeric flavodoxin WrbA
MPLKKIVILDGSDPDDEDLSRILAILIETLKSSGAQIQTLHIRELKLGHCVGCFGCWQKTPGICVQKDAGREIARAVIESDLTVLFSPIRFGCYSPGLKRVIDRIFSPLLQPFMTVYHGETHHLPRYSRYPRLVGVGVQHSPNLEEAAIYKLLVGRNALNLHAPSYAAEVIHPGMDVTTLSRRFQATLEREEEFPHPKTLRTFSALLKPGPTRLERIGEKRALLILGSPKAKTSLSSTLGEYLLKSLEQHGWETGTLKLKSNLRQEKGRTELLSAAASAGLILLAFPLYNDALPVSVLEALELLAAQPEPASATRPQRLAVILNNGFPEAHQDIPALAVCHKFARASGIEWAGGLAFGAGEAFNDGQPFTGRKGLPSARWILKGLDLAAGALAEGRVVPERAVRLVARTPIPMSPFFIWRRIFILKAGKRWQTEAAGNNINKEQMLARPYIEPALPK